MASTWLIEPCLDPEDNLSNGETGAELTDHGKVLQEHLS